MMATTTQTQYSAHLYCLPITPYKKAWEIQKAKHNARVNDQTSDTLFLLQHPPTYTLGRRTKDSSRLLDEKARIKHAIPIYETERGGLITYHGPGQLVGYPIFKLRTYCTGPKQYIYMLEEVLINLLRNFGLQAERHEHCTGVWIENRKIAALGVHINRRVTMHGFSLNVANDLTAYKWITPCGIQNCIMTSMKNELGNKVNLSEVMDQLPRFFENTFGLNLIRKSYQENTT